MQSSAYICKKAIFRARGGARSALLRAPVWADNYYLFNEYPKSGGTWIGQMVAHALDMPFPRNSFPSLKPSIMHGHYLRPWGLTNVAVVWRDPRDLMVSYYYHCYFRNERDNWALVDLMRNRLPFADYEDITRNLPRFLEVMLTRPPWPKFTWEQYATQWLNRSEAVHLTYEAMRAQPCETLDWLLQTLAGRELTADAIQRIVSDYSFEKQTGRNPGEMDATNFVRKGVVGDWVNLFNTEARQILDHYIGHRLIEVGYEPSRSWASAAA